MGGKRSRHGGGDYFSLNQAELGGVPTKLEPRRFTDIDEMEDHFIEEGQKKAPVFRQGHSTINPRTKSAGSAIHHELGRTRQVQMNWDWQRPARKGKPRFLDPGFPQ